MGAGSATGDFNPKSKARIAQRVVVERRRTNLEEQGQVSQSLPIGPACFQTMSALLSGARRPRRCPRTIASPLAFR